MSLWKRLTVTFFSVAIISFFYSTLDIRLFDLGINKRLRHSLFKIFTVGRSDENVIILNAADLSEGEIISKVDSLILCEPRIIGINPCHLKSVGSLKERFGNVQNVVLANCEENNALSLSRILNPDNSVTNFKTDRPDYFEFKIEPFTSAPTGTEVVYYNKARESFYHWELKDISFIKEYFQGKTILIGYTGDYLKDSIYYFNQCRVTPMNSEYGYEDVLPDMYEVEISACIISALHSDIHVHEVGIIPRILIILSFCFISVITITYIRTKWIPLNIFISFILFLVFIVSSGLLIAYQFQAGRYLALDELPFALAFVIIFTTVASILETKSRNGTAAQ